MLAAIQLWKYTNAYPKPAHACYSGYCKSKGPATIPNHIDGSGNEVETLAKSTIF